MKRMNIRKTAASVVVLGLLATAALVSAQLGTGDVYTLTPQYYADTRELIYCEMEFDYDGGTDVFNSTGLSDCDAQSWNFMDLDGLAAQFGYNSLTQNGPQYWAMDILTLNGGEPVNIGGIEMRYGATIPPSNGGIPPYTPFNPEKLQQQPILAGGAENANFDGMHFAPDDKGTILLKTQNRSEGCPTQGNGAMSSCQAEYGPQPVTTVVAVDPDTLDNIDAIALQQGLPDLRKRSWDVRG